VGLQQILADKRSRGAFGEVQLASLVRNLMPESSFKLQHTLPNGKINTTTQQVAGIVYPFYASRIQTAAEAGKVNEE
jgi:hypothetical protein